MDNLFPIFTKSIENLIEDEEGNIPGNKLLMLGTMIIILGSMLSMEVFAKHRSHSSHKSHSSHSSHSSGSYHRSHTSHSSHNSHTSHANSHGSHSSHSSHANSHSSHSSHTSHSNISSHSNSLYSAEGDVKYSAPSVSKIPGISVQPVAVTEETFVLPEVNQNIELPNGTPTSSIMPAFAVPAATPEVKIDAGEIHEPSTTETIK